MRLLGIDYGRRKIGVALSTTKLAEPLQVIKYKNRKNLLGKLRKLVEKHGPDKVVLGVSEAEMAKEIENFKRYLESNLTVPVVLQDETLTTANAKKRAISAGIGREKRRKMEDAYSATLILQSFLDRNA